LARPRRGPDCGAAARPWRQAAPGAGCVPGQPGQARKARGQGVHARSGGDRHRPRRGARALPAAGHQAGALAALDDAAGGEARGRTGGCEALPAALAHRAGIPRLEERWARARGDAGGGGRPPVQAGRAGAGRCGAHSPTRRRAPRLRAPRDRRDRCRADRAHRRHRQDARRQDRAAEEPAQEGHAGLARLDCRPPGGWNCYYKPPGPKAMAIGWRQLAAMVSGYIIATPALTTYGADV